MSPMPPLVSIVMATYDWSAAMKVAIQSILMQTYTNFEVLIVGDACSDDSADVVRAFGDTRLRWFNLSERHGSQDGPNNFGVKQSKSPLIAYIGHDDIWAAAHLSSMVATATETRADVVASVTVMYGPPGSGVRAATGLFATGEFNPRFVFPPSSMMHTRALIEDVGGWRSPSEARLAVDADLVRRFHARRAFFASTGELTTFKFNASWRRNAYQRRNTQEQERTLAELRRAPDAFRMRQLLDVTRSVVEDRFIRTEVPPGEDGTAVENMRQWGAFKGSRRRAVPVVRATDEGVRFFVDDRYVAFEWHDIEMVDHTRWRWTGPSPRSSFDLPIRIDRPFRLMIHVLHVLVEEDLGTATLDVYDRALDASFTRRADGTWTWCADLDPDMFDGQPIITVTIDFPKPRRCIDLGISEDRRWLGLSIGDIDLLPKSLDGPG